MLRIALARSKTHFLLFWRRFRPVCLTPFHICTLV
jgi:hypothetical protein